MRKILHIDQQKCINELSLTYFCLFGKECLRCRLLMMLKISVNGIPIFVNLFVLFM